MKRLHLLACTTMLCALAVPTSALAASSGSQEMYRLYNPYTGEHFYTLSTVERDARVADGWNDEGLGWIAPESSDTPVYRLYNSYAPGGDHHYTMDWNEVLADVAAGWTYENVCWYSDDAKTVALYRQYNPYAEVGTHNYTTSAVEYIDLAGRGWQPEGTAWYAIQAGNPGDTTLAQAAVVAALNQVGEGYSLDDAPGHGFSCNGLCWYAWKQAGINIPAGSTDQYNSARNSGRWVESVEQLNPGDLVFYDLGNGRYHVAMYIGDNKVVQSSRASDRSDGKDGVTIEDVYWCRNFLGGASPI